MFENLTNFFNAQSTLVQIIIVAVVAYVVYMIYVEFTKEKFGSTYNLFKNKSNISKIKADTLNEINSYKSSSGYNQNKQNLAGFKQKINNNNNIDNNLRGNNKQIDSFNKKIKNLEDKINILENNDINSLKTLTTIIQINNKKEYILNKISNLNTEMQNI